MQRSRLKQLEPARTACWRVLVFCLLSVAHQGYAATTGPVTQYGGPQDGSNPNVATNGVLSGSCGYGALNRNDWPYWQAAAIGPSNPLYSGGNQKGCGTCIQVTCTSGCSANAAPAVVLVTDTCDSCSSTQINVQALTFQKYFQSNLVLGQITASWEQVSCNPPGNIQVVVTNSRTNLGGFFVVTLQQVAGTGVISTVEVQSSGSSTWQPMTNSFGAAYQASNFGSAPLSLRITGQGQTLIASNVIPTIADGTYPSQVQFGRSSTTSATTGTPAVLSASSPPVVPPAGLTPPPVPPTSPAVTPARPSVSPAAPPPAASPPPIGSPPPVSLAVPPPLRPPPAPAPPTPVVTPSPGNTTTPPLPAPAISNIAPAPAIEAAAPRPSPAQPATGPAPAVSPGPVQSPLQSRGPAPGQAPGPGPAVAPAATSATTDRAAEPATAMGPGMTALTVNTGLNGTQLTAANQIVNPAVLAAGRRLLYIEAEE